jgi:hypothetical protein
MLEEVEHREPLLSFGSVGECALPFWYGGTEVFFGLGGFVIRFALVKERLVSLVII